MKKVLLAALCLAALYTNGQYEDERFPITPDEVSFNKTHKIASRTAIETVNGKETTKTSKYDKNGYMVYNNSSGYSKNVYHYKYNKKNLLTEVIDSSFDGMFNKWWTNTLSFSYYDNGLLKERSLNENTEEFEFDKKENKLSKGMHDEMAEEVLDYYYDDKQRVIKSVKTTIWETTTTIYQYNADGKVTTLTITSTGPMGYDSSTQITTYNPDGKPAKTEAHTITGTKPLDDMGEPTDGPMEITTNRFVHTYTYDSKGRKVKETLLSNDDPVPAQETTYTYTEADGIVSEAIETRLAGETILTATTQYDKKGLKTEYTAKESARGKPIEREIKYSYTFY